MSTPADELDKRIDDATDHLGDLAARVNAGISNASEDPSNGALIPTVGPILGGIIQGQVDGTNGVVRGVADYATGQANAAGDVVNGYAHASGDLAGAATNVINDQMHASKHAASDLLDGFEHGDPVGGMAHAGGDLLVGGAHQVGDILTGVGHAAGDVGGGLLHGAEDALGGAGKGFEDVVIGTVKELGDVSKGVLEGAAHGLKSLFGGGESKEDILKKFGHESGEKVAGTRRAANMGRDQLEQLSSLINAGKGGAIGTADQILKQGEPGLAYFTYFLPAYDAWTGARETTAELRKTYEDEFGMSFTAYSGDAQLLTEVASALNTSEQALQSAYNALVPTWQGPAAANFEAKLKIFFSGSTTTQQATSGTAKEITSLVDGLQKLVLAKAQIAISLYADTLTPGIDGEMAKMMVKVAKDDAPDDMKRVVLAIFHLAAHGRHMWDSDSYFSSDCLDDASRQAAINAAAEWCNKVLIPATETRIRGLIDACNETHQRIQAAFAKLVSDVKSVTDPFAGMESATAGPTSGSGGADTPQQGGGTGTTPGVPTGTTPGVPTGTTPGVPTGTTPGVPTGTTPGVPTGTTPGAPTGTTPGIPAEPTVPTGTAPGGPTGTTPGVPAEPTVPAGTTPGVPIGTGTPPQQGTDPGPGTNPGTGTGTDPGTTRPTGLPPGAVWIPPGVALPEGWHRARNGEALPKGWHVDPKTGLPVHGNHGAGPGDQKRDVHHHKDGSVSIGRDGEVTISPEGKHGSFAVTETAPDGTVHTYRVHFDKNGDPVVHEVSVDAPGTHIPTGQFGDPFANHGRDSGVPSGMPTVTDQPGGSDLSSGVPGTVGSSLSGVTGQTGADASQLNLGHHGRHAGHIDGTHTQLQEGAHVGVDNAMGAGSGTTGAAAPVAGSAAPGADGAKGGGGFGGFPMMGVGRGGGAGEQESGRRYAQRGDVVGEDDLEEWQRMGPVLGEE